MSRSMWRGAAQGRAIVRNRSMRDARAIKRDMVTVRMGVSPQTLSTIGWRYKMPPLVNWDAESIYQHLAMLMGCRVKRARNAHKDWRMYRQWTIEEESI